MKYTLEFKLKCVERYKQSGSYAYPPGVKSKDSFRSHVRDWARLYDDLGVDGLKHSGTNRERTPARTFRPSREGPRGPFGQGRGQGGPH